jgi:hypothetical protein
MPAVDPAHACATPVAGRSRPPSTTDPEPFAPMTSIPAALASRTSDVVADWFGTSWPQLGAVAASTVAVFLAVIALTRIAGLRSFSKMSSFDFAMTVAVGSVMASTASSPGTTLLNGVAALAVLYAVQVLVARARLNLGAARVVDNTPMLLMHDGHVLHDHMRDARISERDLQARLREAAVVDTSSVLAVVLETTGDISVMQGEGPLDPALLEGVRGSPISSGRPAGGV